MTSMTEVSWQERTKSSIVMTFSPDLSVRLAYFSKSFLMRELYRIFSTNTLQLYECGCVLSQIMSDPAHPFLQNKITHSSSTTQARSLSLARTVADRRRWKIMDPSPKIAPRCLFVV